MLIYLHILVTSSFINRWNKQKKTERFNVLIWIKRKCETRNINVFCRCWCCCCRCINSANATLFEAFSYFSLVPFARYYFNWSHFFNLLTFCALRRDSLLPETYLTTRNISVFLISYFETFLKNFAFSAKKKINLKII